MSVVFFALLSGLIFGAGLTVSRMIDPSVVIGFLDVAGAWNPSLAFVMGGALLVTIPAFALAKSRTSTPMGLPLTLPSRTDIDRPLVLGSLLFGVGWGIAGFCPGPGISALAFGLLKPMIFVAAMVVGMVGFGLYQKKT